MRELQTPKFVVYNNFLFAKLAIVSKYPIFLIVITDW